MLRHPAERWSRLHMSRRDFLRRTAAGATALRTRAAVLAGCKEDAGPGTGDGEEPELRIGTPDSPVELQVFDDNPPIQSDLEVEAREGATLKIFNWQDYFWKRVLEDFAEEYNVGWEYETFYNMEEAISKIETGEAQFDVFFPTIDVVPGLVAKKIIQPLNHDYIPNLSNVWPQLADPFYDGRSQYTVPYTVYHTGIGWGADMVDLSVDDFAAMDDPWAPFWDAANAGIIGLYDDYREALTVGLFRNGVDDVNTGDGAAIEAAGALLQELTALDVRYTIDGAYAKMPEGVFGLHEAWSGDMVATPYYIKTGTDPHFLQYFWPARSAFGLGTVGNDCLAIPKNAQNPVLAHAFLNYYCDFKVAMKNFSWVGYQPAQTQLNPDDLLGPWKGPFDASKGWIDGYVLESMPETIVTEADFDIGKRHLALPAETDLLWQNAFATVTAG